MTLNPLVACLFASAAAALVVTGCGGGDGSDAPGPYTAREGNLFANASFEDGADPWISLAEGSQAFSVSNAQARSGTASALLNMNDTPDAKGIKVYYLVQEISPEELPAVIEGYYRVDEWARGAPKQYLQFVVIAIGPKNFPAEYSNYQVRYLLAGIDTEPFTLANGRFAFVSKKQPKLDRWVPFRGNVRADFERLWGKVPEDFEKLRILFEVRWEDKEAGPGEPRASVYYDDLYAGPGGE